MLIRILEAALRLSIACICQRPSPDWVVFLVLDWSITSLCVLIEYDQRQLGGHRVHEDVDLRVLVS